MYNLQHAASCGESYYESGAGQLAMAWRLFRRLASSLAVSTAAVRRNRHPRLAGGGWLCGNSQLKAAAAG